MHFSLFLSLVNFELKYFMLTKLENNIPISTICQTRTNGEGTKGNLAIRFYKIQSNPNGVRKNHIRGSKK